MSDPLKFLKPGQSNISEALRRKLTAASRQFGKPFTINSGYRSPAYNKKIGGAKRSYHITGNASDLNMGGMSPAQRSQLVNILQQQGITGFGTYSRYPDMLHVDLRPRQNFMFNKSRHNMGSAPEWFQQAAKGNFTAPPPQQVAAAPGAGELQQGTNVGPLLDNPLTRSIVQAKARKQGMEIGKTPEGRIKLSMDGGNMGGLDKLSNVDLLRPQIGPDRAPAMIGKPPSPPRMPPGPSMLANAGPQSIVPQVPQLGGMGGIGNLFSAIGSSLGGDQQETAIAQQQAAHDQQKRMQWALAQGFGRGLL